MGIYEYGRDEITAKPQRTQSDFLVWQRAEGITAVSSIDSRILVCFPAFIPKLIGLDLMLGNTPNSNLIWILCCSNRSGPHKSFAECWLDWKQGGAASLALLLEVTPPSPQTPSNGERRIIRGRGAWGDGAATPSP